MTPPSAAVAKRFFVAPEVVQTSTMDCGPAALKCLLEGFGIPVSYPRLQEACQIDVDGTSINVIEQVAVRLGLEAQQIMIPVDHLLLAPARALPAVVVTRQSSALHFLVAWRRHGPLVQIMDPAKGRRWLRASSVGEEVYVHEHTVPVHAWREWAVSDEFLDSLGERLARLGLTRQIRERLAADAEADPGWRALATLDAATRMLTAIVRSGGLRYGQEASRVLQTLVGDNSSLSDAPRLIPPGYWSVRADPSQPDRIRFSGAVLVRVKGRTTRESHDRTQRSQRSQSNTGFLGGLRGLGVLRRRQLLGRALSSAACHGLTVEKMRELSPGLVTAVEERPYRPVREVMRRVAEDGTLAPALLVWSMLLGAGGVLMEGLLFRAFLEVGSVMSGVPHRLGAMTMLIVFLGALLLLDVAVGRGVLLLGRRLEAQFRIALLEKLPRLRDRFLQSRLVSDMAQRAHGLHALHRLPDLSARLIRSAAQLVLTAGGLVWIDRASAPTAAFAAAVALGIPLAARRILAERELRKRNHTAAMSRFYLDSLLGLVTARTHGAERSIRRGHEKLVVEWARSALHLLAAGVVMEGLQSVTGFCLAAWLVLGYVERGGHPGGMLLFIYWALSIPALGREIALVVQQYPAQRNTLARLLEPLGAADETESPESVEPMPITAGPREIPAGVAVTFEQVNVLAAGRAILQNVTLTIRPREHVAIVGRSGAGKSSLVGVLLGWHQPSSGQVLVDGVSLQGNALATLRRQTAWIDPAVQLWNRSLFENLRYGDAGGPAASLGRIVEAAELGAVIERLPRGLQSRLGEGGALTSGGEGQRVRFGRALARRDVRLVIMDEPFRGLDPGQRHQMLERARAVWRDATLLCITHDISETQAFDRVLVVEDGRIVEHGNPFDLAREAGSAYARLLDAEQAVSNLWSAAGWRRLRLRDGAVVEDPQPVVTPWTVHQGSRGL
jgi:ABC-type bacteriocin/lantibiotic exporter with double-glycine peptidase domain